MCRHVTKGTVRRAAGIIKIEFCIACSRGHSTGHFDLKVSRTIFDRLLRTQNMHYKKISLLTNMISKFDMQFITKKYKSRDFQ